MVKPQTSIYTDLTMDKQDEITPRTKRIIYRQSLNILCVLAISLLVIISLRVDVLILHRDLGETSLTETLQAIMLLATTYNFFSLAQKIKQVRHAAILIGGFFLVLFIREMDVWLDVVAHGSWVIPAIIVAISACFYAYRGGKNTVNEMATILAKPGMVMLVCATVLLLVFSRLYGMSSFWEHVMQDNYLRGVKNISEEAIELLSYSLIALGAFKTKYSMIRH
ncbi:hypothetical protein DZ860_10545 [Vibrio sinensis]|uniref:Uncharacterized protein n=1 Tax=Vibrio sinensis TaxID=2302434 RepID=A0A3A6QJM0_9VIBR|nr:hypothetical protein [Vibrio sinensis]RJX71375.1 hypothetical protein DZ860_10545 [Vibrio sinensis]